MYYYYFLILYIPEGQSSWQSTGPTGKQLGKLFTFQRWLIQHTLYGVRCTLYLVHTVYNTVFERKWGTGTWLAGRCPRVLRAATRSSTCRIQSPEITPEAAPEAWSVHCRREKYARHVSQAQLLDAKKHKWHVWTKSRRVFFLQQPQLHSHPLVQHHIMILRSRSNRNLLLLRPHAHDEWK